jgi:hypothetical protein
MKALRHQRLDRRPGSVSLAVLVALPVLLLLIALAVYAAELREARTYLENNANADALAAVEVLADDFLLLGEYAPADLFARSRQEAQLYAKANLVCGKPVELEKNDNNDPHGDIVFGRVEKPLAPHFVPAKRQESHGISPSLVNAVRITARRTCERGNPLYLLRGPFLHRIPTNATFSSTAMLDREVIGFRPIHSRPVPLVPLALRSDPSGTHKDSWEHHCREGDDHWSFDRSSKPFRRVEAPDGLREFSGRIGNKEATVCLLQIGSSDTMELAEQIERGILPAEFEGLGGELVLDKEGRRIVPGTLIGPTAGTSAFEALAASLRSLRDRGEAYAWPLFREVDEKTQRPILTGFIAARVVDVQVDKEGMLRFTLQQAVLCAASAVTVSSRPKDAPAVSANPYLCKVRLVE